MQNCNSSLAWTQKTVSLKQIIDLVSNCILSFHRGWIVGEKSDHRSVNVFFVDYGNTATMDRRHTSLTTPYIWETKPILQPFAVSGEAFILTFPIFYLKWINQHFHGIYLGFVYLGGGFSLENSLPIFLLIHFGDSGDIQCTCNL